MGGYRPCVLPPGELRVGLCGIMQDSGRSAAAGTCINPGKGFCTKIDIYPLHIPVQLLLCTTMMVSGGPAQGQGAATEQSGMAQPGMAFSDTTAWKCVCEYTQQQDILRLGSTCRLLRGAVQGILRDDIVVHIDGDFDYDSLHLWLSTCTNHGAQIRGTLTLVDWLNEGDAGAWCGDSLNMLRRLELSSVVWTEPVLPALQHLELESSSVDIGHLTGLNSLILGEPTETMYLLALQHLTRLTRLDIRVGAAQGRWLDEHETDAGAWPVIAQLSHLCNLQQLCIAQLNAQLDYPLLTCLTALTQLSFRTITLDGDWFHGVQLSQVEKLVLSEEAELHAPSTLFNVFVGLTSLTITTSPVVGPALTSLSPLSCLTGLQQLTVRPWLPSFDTELTALTPVTQINRLV